MSIEFLQDLRYAGRTLRRNIGFSAVAVLSLALGIGATTSVFSVVDRILFRSLPFADSARLVSIGIQAPVLPYDFVLGAGYLALRRNPPSHVQAVTSWTGVNDCDLTEGEPVRLSCAAAEASFLATLGVLPILGRSFTSTEDAPNAPRTALLSYALWQARFGGRADILERTVSLDGQPVRIVGILPSDFETPTLARADLVVPQRLDDATLARAVTGRPLRVIARLRPGASVRQMQAQAGGILAAEQQSAHAHLPGGMDVAVRARSLRDLQVGDAALVSRVLFGAVLAVLLLACANVINLLLARSVAREREISIRKALGASPWQLLRQAVTESLLLAIAGGAAGILLAFTMLRLFVRLAPQGIPRLAEAAIDLRVLAVSLACSVFSGLVFGLAPAVSRGGRRLRSALVVAQFALSLALLTGAGLLGRALWQFQQKPLGMDTQHVTTASLSLSLQRYPGLARQFAFSEQLETRLRAIPGVTFAAISDSAPPNVPLRSRPGMAVRIAGRDTDPHLQGSVAWRAVSDGYFEALGIHMRKGRTFTEQDRASGDVAILSQSLARRLFGSGEPIGQYLELTGSNIRYRIVGVAENVRNSGGTAPDDPEYYVPRAHSPDSPTYAAPDELRRVSVILRTSMEAGAAARLLRESIAALDASLPVQIATLEETSARLAVRPRFNALVLGLFAAIGLALAAFGLYGVLAFLVAQRTREIGVRMALGATPSRIAGMVLAGAARWLAFGLLIGVWLSLGLARGLQSLLLGVAVSDPLAWLSAAAILLAAAFAAAWLPARRAASADPMEALRHE